MKEIKTTRTIEEVTGYEAFDGTVFKTEEECIKYEGTAEAVITKRFLSHVVKGNRDRSVIVYSYSTKILHGYEEDVYVLYDVKDEEAVKDFEMYAQLKEFCRDQDISKYKGKIVLVLLYDGCDERCFIEGTEEEILEDFRKFVKKTFDCSEDKEKE